MLSQLDLLEIMPCIICTCCKLDPSLGHQSDVSLKCNITLGRVSRMLSWVFKILQFILCVVYVGCCIRHCGKHFLAGLSNSLKTFSLKLSVWRWEALKKYSFATSCYLLLDFYFMKVWLYGWSCETRKAIQGGPFLFSGRGSLEGQSINLFEFIHPVITWVPAGIWWLYGQYGFEASGRAINFQTWGINWHVTSAG